MSEQVRGSAMDQLIGDTGRAMFEVYADAAADLEPHDQLELLMETTLSVIVSALCASDRDALLELIDRVPVRLRDMVSQVQSRMVS